MVSNVIKTLTACVSSWPREIKFRSSPSTFLIPYPRYICVVDMRDKVLQVMKRTLFAELYTVEIDFVPRTDVWRWFPWQHDVSCWHVVGSVHVSFDRFYGDFRRCIWCWKRTKLQFIILSLYDPRNSFSIMLWLAWGATVSMLACNFISWIQTNYFFLHRHLFHTMLYIWIFWD